MKKYPVIALCVVIACPLLCLGVMRLVDNVEDNDDKPVARVADMPPSDSHDDDDENCGKPMDGEMNIVNYKGPIDITREYLERHGFEKTIKRNDDHFYWYEKKIAPKEFREIFGCDVAESGCVPIPNGPPTIIVEINKPQYTGGRVGVGKNFVIVLGTTVTRHEDDSHSVVFDLNIQFLPDFPEFAPKREISREYLEKHQFVSLDYGKDTGEERFRRNVSRSELEDFLGCELAESGFTFVPQENLSEKTDTLKEGETGDGNIWGGTHEHCSLMIVERMKRTDKGLVLDSYDVDVRFFAPGHKE